MVAEITRINIKEFREAGYLQEVNRQFFHPFGLALEVNIDEDGTETLGGVWDYRDDPEGMIYDDDGRLKAKAKAIAKIAEERRPIRKAALGFWVEPA